jgi:hypothetical protein
MFMLPAAAAIAEASSPSSLAAMESTKTKAAKIVPKKREHTNGTSPEAKRHNGSHSPNNKPEGINIYHPSIYIYSSEW